jgi:hypothetical protein
MNIRLNPFVLCASTLALTALAPNASANLINNGDFESPYGAGNWSVFANGYRETVAFALSGTSVGKVFGAFSGASGIFQDFAAAPGQAFNATVFGYNWTDDAMQADNAAFLRVTFFDAADVELSGGVNSGAIDINTPKDTWTLVSAANALAPTGTATGRVFILFTQPGNNGGAAFFDNVEVNPVPEPMTMAVLGAGIAGVMARRRRR